MDTFNLCVAFVLVAAFGSGLTANICEDGTCSCSPDGLLISIQCNCNATNQHLDFNDQHFGPNMNTVSKVNISNCDQVTFNTNSFRQLDNLQKLVVSRVRSAIFNPGVFQSLKNLTLVQIQSLDFKQGAFMGVKELEEIEIHNSYIPQLASHSFYDIKDLKLVSLTNVTVNVKRNAIKVEMAKTDSEVIFTDCMIRSVEENGITVKTDTFIIRNSTVGNLAPNSITINSTEAILITQSQFNSTLDSNAIHMTAPNVTIDSNVFDLLSMEILANINSKSNGKVIFTNNTIHDIVLGTALEKIGRALESEIDNNRFNCTCTFAKSVSLLPSVFVNNNFCLAKCKVSLNDFGTHVKNNNACDSVAALDLNAIAKCDDASERSATITPTHRTREGRTGFPATQIPIITTTPKSIATTHLASTILTVSLVTLVLPQLA